MNHLTNKIRFVLCCLVLLPQLYCLFAQVEIWPYSNYPMFSKNEKISDVHITKLALVDSSGNVVWWKPRNEYFYIKDFNSGYARAQALELSDPVRYQHQIKRFVKNFPLRVIANEQPDLNLQEVQIVSRSMKKEMDDWVVADKTLQVLEIKDLQ